MRHQKEPGEGQANLGVDRLGPSIRRCTKAPSSNSSFWWGILSGRGIRTDLAPAAMLQFVAYQKAKWAKNCSTDALDRSQSAKNRSSRDTKSTIMSALGPDLADGTGLKLRSLRLSPLCFDAGLRARRPRSR